MLKITTEVFHSQITNADRKISGALLLPMTDITKNLEDYGREIYIVVLGLGFTFFVSDFIEEFFNKNTFSWDKLIYFIAIYYFFTYDWIAYTTLLDRFPYKPTPKLLSLGRLYCDLFALLIKTSLIFLSTQTKTASHILSSSVLFAIWHSTIAVWYFFAKRDYNDLPPIWKSHLYMILVYGVFASSVGIFSYFFPLLVNGWKINLWLVGLCLIIMIHAAKRKSYLLQKLTVSG